MSGLTPREIQIAGLIARGLMNKEIATHLEIAVPTVKNHIHRIFAKLGVDRRGKVALQLMAAGTPDALRR